jgi:hypothetical protein
VVDIQEQLDYPSIHEIFMKAETNLCPNQAVIAKTIKTQVLNVNTAAQTRPLNMALIIISNAGSVRTASVSSLIMTPHPI